MNNISEYSIINTERIKDLKLSYSHGGYIQSGIINQMGYENGHKCCQEILEILEEILNNSIPLEGVVRDAYIAGSNRANWICGNGNPSDGIKFLNKEDYIKNLNIKK